MARSAALFLASLAVALAAPATGRGGDPGHLDAAAAIVEGAELDAPFGIGFPLLIAPAYALGGTALVEVLLAAIAALGFVLAAALARRLVPEPWATGGVAAVALSAPAAAGGTFASPEMTAGALLAGAALLALRVRERPSLREAVAAGLLIGLLPWLAPVLLIPGLPILAAMSWWLARRGRRLVAVFAAEAVGASLIAYVSVNEALYGRPTPRGEAPAFVADRIVPSWVGREAGLLRWAPVVALAFVGAWLLWRSRRERLAVAVPDVRDREAAAELLLLVLAAVALAGVLVDSPSGWPLVTGLTCAAALAAWGLRHHPRAGGALAALSLLVTGWLLAGGGDPWWPLIDAGALAALAAIVAGEARSHAALK